MQDFEKLGQFYLGRSYDLANRKQKDELVLYDSKDLVTHAVCVGGGFARRGGAWTLSRRGGHVVHQ